MGNDESLNAGVDFSVLGGRLTGSLDYYFKKTTDMIMGQRLPSFSGFSTITTNLGEVQNQGFEIALNSTNIETKDFTWNTSAGFSINKNRINHIYYDYDENGVERDDTSNNWYIGQLLAPSGITKLTVFGRIILRTLLLQLW